MLQPHFTSDTLLKWGSLVWLLYGGVLAGVGSGILDEAGVSTRFALAVAVLSVCMALVLWPASFFLKNLCRRVKICSIVYFVTAIIPALLMFGFIGLALFFLPVLEPGLQQQLRWLVLVSMILWCALQVWLIRRRIVERRFIEKELFFDDDKIIFRRPPKTDLDAPPISDKTFFGKIAHKVIPFVLIVLMPMGFPLQRLATNAGGLTGFLVLLAAIGAPFFIYGLGKLASRAYVYFYLVSKLERQHGKPVVFSDSVAI